MKLDYIKTINPPLIDKIKRMKDEGGYIDHTY